MTSLLSAKARRGVRRRRRRRLRTVTALRPELRRAGRRGEHPAAPASPVSTRPRPEFTADLRERLMAEAATSLPQDNAAHPPDRAARAARERRGSPSPPRLARAGRRHRRHGRGSAERAARRGALPDQAWPRERAGRPRTDRPPARPGPARPGRQPAGRGPGAVRDSSDDLSRVPATIDDFTAQAGRGHRSPARRLRRRPATRPSIDELHAFAADNLAQLQDAGRSRPRRAPGRSRGRGRRAR